MKIFALSVVLLTLLLPLFIFTERVEAKVLPQAKKTTGSVVKSLSTTINVSPKLRADRRAVVIYFSNLQNAKSVSYLLTYQQNGQEEGAMGGLDLKAGSNQTAELLFGTCSKNVCRYHTNIKNARLEVSYTSLSNKKYLKKYKLKV